METVTVSSTYRIVIPLEARERLGLTPGAKLTAIDKGGVLFLVPECPMREHRGVALGTSPREVREK